MDDFRKPPALQQMSILELQNFWSWTKNGGAGHRKIDGYYSGRRFFTVFFSRLKCHHSIGGRYKNTLARDIAKSMDIIRGTAFLLAS